MPVIPIVTLSKSNGALTYPYGESAPREPIFVATDVAAVNRLLDSNGKININLMHASLLNSKKPIGTINANTNFATLLTAIDAYNGAGNTILRGGSYFIANGRFTISASAGHIVAYSDETGLPETELTINRGDHLFYIQGGVDSFWITTASPSGETNLNTRIYADENELASNPPSGAITKAIVDNIKITDLGATASSLPWGTASYFNYPSGVDSVQDLHLILNGLLSGDATFMDWWNDYYTDATFNTFYLKCDSGYGNAYYKIEDNSLTKSLSQKTYYVAEVSGTYTHRWGIINNTYELATVESAGLMASADKIKLNALYNYEHHSQAAISINTSGVDVIDIMSVDAEGHVTSASKRPLPNVVSGGAAGVMTGADKARLDGMADNATKNTAASSAEVRLGTDNVKFVTPQMAKEAHNWYGNAQYFASLATANALAHPAGTMAFIKTSEVEV